jgi:hypothetical protein
MKNKQHYISINGYRSSTGHGFSNTWKCYRISAQDRKQLLDKGLAVRDEMTLGPNGERGPVLSTMGIRAATPSEIRLMKKNEANGIPQAEVSWVPADENQSGGWNFTV